MITLTLLQRSEHLRQTLDLRKLWTPERYVAPTPGSMPMTGDRISYILWWIMLFSGWQHEGTVFFPLVAIVLVHLNAICGRNIGFSACCDHQNEDCRNHLFW